MFWASLLFSIFLFLLTGLYVLGVYSSVGEDGKVLIADWLLGAALKFAWIGIVVSAAFIVHRALRRWWA